MTQEEINKLIIKNNQLTFLIGYSLRYILRAETKTDQDKIKQEWLLQSIENVVYKDEPIPPVP